MLGTQTQGGRMVGADASTELLRHQITSTKLSVKNLKSFSDAFFNNFSHLCWSILMMITHFKAGPS